MAGRPKTTLPKRIHTVNVRLDDPTVVELEAIALEEGRTRSNLIAQALREWLSDRRARRQRDQE